MAKIPGLRFRTIPGGSFLMGSERGQEVEQPLHRVFLESFSIAETQVTVEQYTSFLEATRREPPPQWHDANFNHPEQPVVAVSWLDAAAFCAWLTSETGSVHRLPTEAEWEFAARGGLEGAMYPWGDDLPNLRPHYDERWAHGPERVRGTPPNNYGLFEMCENVHEWCSDWYQPNYYSVSPENNPQGPESGERKSSRGGSWRHHIKISRCAARSSIPPDFKYADYGFRVARSV
jgi:sulfatase modifying factor 1